MIFRNILHLVWVAFIIAAPCFGDDSALPLSSEEQGWINKNLTVRVRIGNIPPFMISDGKIQGISIDYLTYIFNRNGIKYQYISK